MAAIRIFRRLQDLQDVDPNGLPDQGVPKYDTLVSSFVVETIAGGGGGSFSLGASNLGNTLGQTGVTGTRVVLAGIGNLTLSQLTDANGGTISISGGTAGGAGFSGGVSGGNTAGDTGATGTRLVFAGGNSITLSQATDANGGTITVSGATTSQSVQTQSRFNLTLDGNTSGALALVSSGVLTLVGGNSITLSQNGNAITISGATTSQSVQTQNMVAVTLSGNTSGALALVSSGTLTLAGGNNITVSQNGNAITISGPNVGGAQTGISGIVASDATYTSGTVTITGSGNITVLSGTGQRVIISGSQSVQPETQTFIGGIIASDTTYTSGSVRFTGVGGGVTVSSNTGQRVDISVAAQSAESQSFGMSNIGNTSGTTGIASGAQIRFLLAGGNNVTLSQSLNGASGTITISAASQSAESQSHGMSNLGNTSGTTGIASGAQVRMLFAGGNNITLSQSLNGASGTITISGPNAQTGISGIANSQTTYTSGTVSLSELGAITIRSTTGNQFQFSVNAQTGTQFSAGISGGNTSGDTGTVGGRVVLAGGNNITLSGSTNGASETITISAAAQTVESQSIGMSNVGNTSGTTGMASGAQVRFVFAGGNNITLSQSLNGASGTITISAPNLGAGAMSAGVSNLGNTAGSTGVTGTQLVLVGSGVMSLSQSTGANGGTVSILAPATSVLSAVAPLSTSTNGSTISILGPAQLSVGFSTNGNTAGDTGLVTGRMMLVGSNNITLSGSTNGGSQTISIIGGAGGGAGFSAGVSTGGNTAGATGVSGSQMVLVGSGVMSLSQTTGANGNTVSFLAPATSALVGTSGISISTAGSTISILPIANTSFNPFQQAGTGTGQQGQASLHVQPLKIPHLQFDRILMSYQISNASNSSNSITLSNWVGIYTRNNSTLSLISSISTSTNFSGSGTVGSYSLYGGLRQLSMPWTMTLSSGDYWVGVVTRTTTGGGAGHTLNQILRTLATISSNVTGWSGLLGAATNATVQQQLGLGTYSVSTAGIPSTIGFSELTGTGTMPLQIPLFHFRSGTV